MSTDRDVTRIVRSWLEEGVTSLPDRVLDDVLDHLPATPQRRAWWPARRFSTMNNAVKIALASAAVVAVALIGFGLLNGQNVGNPGVGDSSPTPTQLPTPTPEDLQRQSGSLAPASYFIDSIPPLRITFTVPGGWSKNIVREAVWTENSEARVAFTLVDNVYVDGCATGLGLRDPAVGPTVDDLASALSSLPALEPTSPSDVTLAGFAGKRVDLTAPASLEGCDGGQYSLWGAVPLDPGEHRLWILDVDGTRLVIHGVNRAGASTQQVEQLQAIIDSIQIRIEPPA